MDLINMRVEIRSRIVRASCYQRVNFIGRRARASCYKRVNFVSRRARATRASCSQRVNLVISKTACNDVTKYKEVTHMSGRVFLA